MHVFFSSIFIVQDLTNSSPILPMGLLIFIKIIQDNPWSKQVLPVSQSSLVFTTRKTSQPSGQSLCIHIDSTSPRLRKSMFHCKHAKLETQMGFLQPGFVKGVCAATILEFFKKFFLGQIVDIDMITLQLSYQHVKSVMETLQLSRPDLF